MPSILPKEASDQIGKAAAPWAEVHSTIIKIAGVDAAKITRPVDTFGAPTDTTAGNASAGAHGFMSKDHFIKLEAIDLSQITDGDMLRSVYDPGNVAGDAFALGNMTGTLATAQIAAKAVTRAKTADMPTARIVGRLTAGAGEAEDLSAPDVRTFLNVADGAQVNPSAAAIKSAYEGNADTNAYTDVEKAKLAGIAAGAQVNPTAAAIKSAYEGNADTNAYTDVEKTKLAGIAAGAQVNPTAAAIKSAYEGNADTNAYTDAAAAAVAGLGNAASKDVGTTAGTVAAGDDSRLSNSRTPTAHAASHTNGTDDIQNATAAQKGLMTASYALKLDGVESGAQVNPTAAAIKSAYEGNADTNAFTDAAAAAVAGLGNAASKDVGTTAGTVAAGDDSRLSNSRTPTAHKSTHATGGSDALSPADIGAATATQGGKADTAVQPGSLATVATSGAYSDLSGAPTAFDPASPGVIGGTASSAGTFKGLTITTDGADTSTLTFSGGGSFKSQYNQIWFNSGAGNGGLALLGNGEGPNGGSCTIHGTNSGAFRIFAGNASLELGLLHATTPTAQKLKAHDVTTGTGASLTLAGGAGSTAKGGVILDGGNRSNLVADATDLASAITLVNALKQSAIDHGLMKAT